MDVIASNEDSDDNNREEGQGLCDKEEGEEDDESDEDGVGMHGYSNVNVLSYSSKLNRKEIVISLTSS
ncbi:Hypothetical predicted protein [Octopus vulgaris]|uniref:Uncharacterized protein n=1 Tax=Octopus vulgaris TaxID=6645 RepID=A0AA36FD94_OCTVU|nr:Hypothetical predicted protein [Octopus vulgaris]